MKAQALIKAAQTAAKAGPKLTRTEVALKHATELITSTRKFTTGLVITGEGDMPMTMRGVEPHFAKIDSALTKLQQASSKQASSKQALLAPKLSPKVQGLVTQLETTRPSPELFRARSQAMHLVVESKLTTGEYGAVARSYMKAVRRTEEAGKQADAAKWAPAAKTADAGGETLMWGVGGRPYYTMVSKGQYPGEIMVRNLEGAELESLNRALDDIGNYEERLRKGQVTSAEYMFRTYGGL